MFLTFWAKIIRVTHFFAVILPFCVVNRFATNKNHPRNPCESGQN